jgi:sugar/nucleoside kinase (ribokinase family)
MMTSVAKPKIFVAKPKIFGTGLIALDLVLGPDPNSPVRSWTGGTCGNVLSILAYLGWEAFPIARMNRDPASERVRADLTQWGVRLDFTSCGPTAHTPIIIQEIKRGRDGKPKHRFSWSCPKCGEWLPAYKPVTTAAVDAVAPAMTNASVFFLDRLSRAALSLAKEASDRGAVVVFEPSGKGADKLMAEAVKLAHIVKYADQRLAGVDGLMRGGSATIVEVRTLGEHGLKYRHKFGRAAPSEWIHFEAIHAPRLADSCGAGDWSTAGLLAKATVGGLAGLREGGAHGVRSALRYGQALAAWNCGFEGARGGMYAVARDTFDAQISDLMAGHLDPVTNTASDLRPTSVIDCPNCQPARKVPAVRARKTKRATAA